MTGIRTDGVFTHPTKVGPDPGPDGVAIEQWVLDADSAHYRALIVRTILPLGDPQDMYPPDTYVMVEPANLKRLWFPLNRPDRVSESYIMEKTGCRGADARNLTTLLAGALGVSPIYVSEEGT